MSKGNLFLGQGRGAVGDVVFTRVNGEQVARARNRHPKNPKTVIQLLQRVIMKTSALSYSMFRDITDHSFQGKQMGTENQSEYARLNVTAMRSQLAELINDNDAEEILSSTEFNFAGRNDALPVLREYIMSSGNLPPVTASEGRNGFEIPQFIAFEWDLSASGGAGPSYADFVAAFGLQQGDQMTFLFAYVDDTQDGPAIINFKYSRIILEPADGDMTKRIFAPISQGATDYSVWPETANPRNEGNIFINSTGQVVGRDNETEYVAGTRSTLAGFAVIVSRQSGGVWLRSRAVLTARSNEVGSGTSFDHGTAILADAIYSFMKDTSSTLYLNQAEAGV